MVDTPTCPKCGYDLSGAVRSWTDRCPTKGVCSECGLEFNWGVLLLPLMHGTIELLDSATRPNVHCLLHSVLRCYRPWKLWPEAVLGDHFRLRRTVLVALVGAMATHAMLLLLAQVIEYTLIVIFSIAHKDWWELEYILETPLFTYRDWGSTYGEYDFGIAWAALVLTWSLMTAALAFAPSSQVGAFRMEVRDWLRVWLHSFPTLPIVVSLVGLFGLVQLLPTRAPYLDELIVAFRLTFLVGWFALWWAFAYERYFDVDRPWIRGLAMSLIGGVIAIILIGVFWSARIILG